MLVWILLRIWSMTEETAKNISAARISEASKSAIFTPAPGVS